MPENDNDGLWSVDYAVTITTRGLMRRKSPEEQYEILNSLIHKHFGTKMGVKCSMVAELHESYDVHLHGILSFRLMWLPPKYQMEPIRWLHDVFRKDKLIGRIHSKQLECYAGWVEYITKDMYSDGNLNSKIYNIMGCQALMMDDYNIIRGIEDFLESVN